LVGGGEAVVEHLDQLPELSLQAGSPITHHRDGEVVDPRAANAPAERATAADLVVDGQIGGGDATAAHASDLDVVVDLRGVDVVPAVAVHERVRDPVTHHHPGTTTFERRIAVKRSSWLPIEVPGAAL
jgi:hypothetical protein